MLWGSNIPQTRTPDAHFMTEARYRGQKVVVVSPDYAGHTKFADHWLHRRAGDRCRARDGDGPRDRQGALRREADAVLRRVREEAHRPAVPRLAARARRRATSPTASCAPPTSARRGERRVEDRRPRRGAGEPVGAERLARLPLGRGGRGALEPRARRARAAAVAAGRARRARPGRPRALRDRRDRGRRHHAPRRARHKRIGGALVTTVFDLLCAQLGVARDDLPGDWPAGYDDPPALHAGLAAGAHRRRRRAGHADRPRVRPQRRGHRRAAR